MKTCILVLKTSTHNLLTKAHDMTTPHFKGGQDTQFYYVLEKRKSEMMNDTNIYTKRPK